MSIQGSEARRAGGSGRIGIAVVLAAGILALAQAGRGEDAKKPTVEVIAAAWARYQNDVKSVRLEWTDSIFVPKETIEVQAIEGEKKPSGQSGKQPRLPPQDEKIQGDSRLILDGTSYRFTSQGYHLDRDTGKFKAQKCDGASVGGIIKAYMPPGDYDHLLGNINHAKATDIPRIHTATPPFLIFRSLTVGLANPRDYRIADRVGHVDGRPCVILEKGSSSARFGLWVDPARGYLVVRQTTAIDGKEIDTTTYSYVQDKRGIWVPTGWRGVEVGLDGRLRQSLTATVTRVEVNVNIDPKDLVLEFPPGTLVRDFTKPSELGDNTQYILREDGSHRLLDRRDRGAPYDRLLATETGQANNPARSRIAWRWVILLSTLGVLGAAAIVAAWKRWASTKGAKAG